MKKRNKKKVANNISISSNLTQNVIIPNQINVEPEVTSIEIKRDTQLNPEGDTQPNQEINKLPNTKRDKILNYMKNYISLPNNDQLLHELQGKFECSKCKKMFIKNKKLVQELYTCPICNQIICSECSCEDPLKILLKYCEDYLNQWLSNNSDYTATSIESNKVAISIMLCDIKNEFKDLDLPALTCTLCIIAAINEYGTIHRCLIKTFINNKSFPIYYSLLEISKNVKDAINVVDEMD
jgi:hypothetical protein